jgi:hypothetical protein
MVDQAFRLASFQSRRAALSVKRACSAALVETGLDTVVLIWLSRKTKAARVNGS